MVWVKGPDAEEEHCNICGRYKSAGHTQTCPDLLKERFVTPEPLPGPYEQELLLILMEECDEASIRASKMKRFGVNERQPGQALTNKERLGLEIGDIFAMVAMLSSEGLVDQEDINRGMANKSRQLAKFMQEHKP